MHNLNQTATHFHSQTQILHCPQFNKNKERNERTSLMIRPNHLTDLYVVVHKRYGRIEVVLAAQR